MELGILLGIRNVFHWYSMITTRNPSYLAINYMIGRHNNDLL